MNGITLASIRSFKFGLKAAIYSNLPCQEGIIASEVEFSPRAIQFGFKLSLLHPDYGNSLENVFCNKGVMKRLRNKIEESFLRSLESSGIERSFFNITKDKDPRESLKRVIGLGLTNEFAGVHTGRKTQWLVVDIEWKLWYDWEQENKRLNKSVE